MLDSLTAANVLEACLSFTIDPPTAAFKRLGAGWSDSRGQVFDTQDYVGFVGVGCFSESRKLFQSVVPGREANGATKHEGVSTGLGGE